MDAEIDKAILSKAQEILKPFTDKNEHAKDAFEMIKEKLNSL